MNLNEEKLRYIYDFLDNYIYLLICRALDSNGKNCRYSFVTIEKIILCYIDLENAFGYSYGYHNLKEYFKANLFSGKEYRRFKRYLLNEQKMKSFSKEAMMAMLLKSIF